jgi:hypothetical protein
MSVPRNIPAEDPVGSRELSSLRPLIDRPLLIVGNGPSSAMPPLDRLPPDPVVFRMNWFFLESHYQFGSHVDAWLYAIPNQGLESHLRDEIASGRYTLDRLCSPMRVPALREGERWFSQLYDLGLEELDHWAAIARNARLGRFFMSRPLPTSGMQALGFALTSGFKEIYLCGIDLYEQGEARYGYVVPDEIRAVLEAKDVAPGYEEKHALDRDLAFLLACLEEFPDAEVYTASDSRHLERVLKKAPAREPGDRLSDRPLPRQRELRTRTVALPGAGEPIRLGEGVDPEMWAERSGRRCAYVTLVSNAFHHGARALANSLRQVSDVPLLCLTTPSAERQKLEASGIHCIDVPEIINPNILKGSAARFAATYTKLHVFRLDFLDRAVYLDSDTIVFRNVDELFEVEGFAAVPDAGLTLPSDIFNSGVFSTAPSQELFSEMMDLIDTVQSYDGGDQGFLNEFFTEWQRLPAGYNVTKRMYSHHADLYSDEDVKILHYVGRKPWQPSRHPDRYSELEWRWYGYLDEREIRELLVELRHSVSDDDPQEYNRGSLLRRAQARNRNGDHAAAEALLTREWPGEHATSALEREMATALRKQGRYAEALPRLEAAMMKNPTSNGIAKELEAVRSRLGLEFS